MIVMRREKTMWKNASIKVSHTLTLKRYPFEKETFGSNFLKVNRCLVALFNIDS